MHGGFDCRYREEYKPRTFVEGTTTWKSKIFRSKRRSSLSIIQVVVSYTKVCMFYSTYKIICDYTTKFWCEQIWIKIASSKEVYSVTYFDQNFYDLSFTPSKFLLTKLYESVYVL
jgi:hypothetical protein